MDWIRTDAYGRGYVNILSAKRLIQSPTVYSTFLLWMLSELFERLPEVGDPEKPRMVFFFDEAHLLFEDINKALLQKIIQIVKLIRSKGVGVYFVTQSPSDIPNEVLAQLSNKVQHALRAYTPAEQKAIRAVADSFRANPAFRTEAVIQELGVGEALVSFLDKDGVPSVVQRARILPPQSRLGEADSGAVRRVINTDEMSLKYDGNVDRRSAYEILTEAEKQLEREALAAAEAEKQEKIRRKEEKAALREAEKRKKVGERAASAAASTVASAVGRNIVNSLTGGKITSTGTIVKRAASNALSSVMRSGSAAVIRGLFGTKKY